MGRISHTIKIKLGTDEHVLKKNLEDIRGCVQCSLRSVCFEIGQTQRKNLCDALIYEVSDYPKTTHPYGGILNVKLWTINKRIVWITRNTSTLTRQWLMSPTTKVFAW